MPKSDCPPSTSVVECPLPLPKIASTLACLTCGDTMNNVRTIPKLGVLPELLVFVCPSCKGVDTKEIKRAA
jgi:hypothetical protein